MAQAWNWYEPGIKKDLKKWNTNLRLEYSSLAPGTFLLERPKKSCSIYFPTAGFPETLCE